MSQESGKLKIVALKKPKTGRRQLNARDVMMHGHLRQERIVWPRRHAAVRQGYCCRPENSEDMCPGLAGDRSDVILLRDPMCPLFQNCDFTMVLDVW
jgi:hypothetical protein